jgi:hypothetical protein
MSKWLVISIALVLMIAVEALVFSQPSSNAVQRIAAAEGDSGRSRQIDQITLHYQAYEKDRQGPVGFSHLKHARKYGINCWECHHEYGDGETNTWAPWGTTEKCIECHDPNTDAEGAISLTAAFHLNCMTCHEERDIYNGDVEQYDDCGKCHLRDIRIENKGYEEDRKGPVTFSHRKHENEYLHLNGDPIACEDCHHEYVNGRNIWTEGDNVKSCGAKGCHDPLIAKGERQHKLRIAYHQSCKKCHKAVSTAATSKVAPFKRCSVCHR